LLVLVAVQRGDGPEQARRLAERLVSYRVFEDDAGKMNRDVREAEGALLLVPQFTLAADTRKGNRPSFSGAAEPERGREMFDLLVRETGRQWARVSAGRFGATMSVELVNEGPVTIWLEIPPGAVAAARPDAVPQQ
jgi:D-tyrosyl-tRNA(Tyr) deacylase